jgi:TolB-like protein/Tfp pilus assembly protein PilF
MSQTRRLAAIMFTDIVGYTKLMQTSESEAVKLRNRHREVFDSMHANYQGRIIQYYGDGTLSIFENTADAVRCAIDIQLALSSDPKVPLRIGIHMGEILLSDSDIIGDSVNLAARIEALGAAGAILVSESVKEQIKNKSEFQLVKLGQVQVKNVEDPLALYALANQGLFIPSKDEFKHRTSSQSNQATYSWKRMVFAAVALISIIVLAWLWGRSNYEKASPILLGESSLAVLPFENLAAEPLEAYFIDGIHEDILNNLARIPSLRVKSRASTTQYRDQQSGNIKQLGMELGVAKVLTGSIRSDRDNFRISVQLIDALSESILWTETYNRESNEILSVQFEIARSIAEVLNMKVDQENLSAPSPGLIDISAYDLVLQARSILRDYQGRKDNERLISILQHAIEIENYYAPAYALLGAALYKEIHYGASPKIWKDSALTCIDKALALDPRLPVALSMKSIIYDNPQVARSEEALELRAQALEASPSNSADMYQLGWKLFWNTDQTEKAVNLILESIKLDWNLKDPKFYCNLASIYQTFTDYDNALQYYSKALILNPDHLLALNRTNLLLYYLGEYEKAIPFALKWHQNDPQSYMPINFLGLHYSKLSQWKHSENTWRLMAELETNLQPEADSLQVYLPWRHRLAHALSQQGKTKEALEIAQQDLELVTQNSLQFPTNIGQQYALAAIQAFLGNQEAMFDALELSVHSYPFIPSYEILRVDPIFEPYHDLPRFKEIEKQYYELRYSQETYLKMTVLREQMYKFESSLGKDIYSQLTRVTVL